MADIFLSYSGKDRARIEAIASALGEFGISVWYDARLQSGSSFDEVIGRELESAALVIACWSPDAAASQWTRAEALFALERRKLAAVFLEACKLNPPFNLIHAEDLRDWTGKPNHHGFAQLIERIAAALGRPGLVEMRAALAGGGAGGAATSFFSQPRNEKAIKEQRAAMRAGLKKFEVDLHSG